MEYDLQSKLLRVLETGEFMRIGGTKPIKVDVRIISATNRDISRLIHEMKFREDLYYRLNVISLEIPPLRMRPGDIAPLVEYFFDKYNKRLKKRYTVPDATIEILNRYHYPGNVRELFNILEFAASTSETEEIKPNDLPIFSKLSPQPSVRRSLSDATRSSEKGAIEEMLKSFGTSLEGKRKAASHLGISLATLYNKIRQYDI